MAAYQYLYKNRVFTRANLLYEAYKSQKSLFLFTYYYYFVQAVVCVLCASPVKKRTNNALMTSQRIPLGGVGSSNVFMKLFILQLFQWFNMVIMVFLIVV